MTVSDDVKTHLLTTKKKSVFRTVCCSGDAALWTFHANTWGWHILEVGPERKEDGVCQKIQLALHHVVQWNADTWRILFGNVAHEVCQLQGKLRSKLSETKTNRTFKLGKQIKIEHDNTVASSLGQTIGVLLWNHPPRKCFNSRARDKSLH